MSSIQSVSRALQTTLNDLSPSSIIDEGYVTIFHAFFAKGTYNEFIQFKPPTFESQQLGLSHQPPIIPSPPHTSGNVSFTPPIVAGGPNPSCVESTASSPRNQHQQRQKKRSIDDNIVTPESFERQKKKKNKKQKNIRSKTDTSELIQGIKNKKAQGSGFYRTLWDNREVCQLRITDSIHRYKALQQIIDYGAKDEVKNIYRQRIAHILRGHELEVIMRSIPVGELSKGVGRRTLTIDKLSEFSRKDRGVVERDIRKGRHYLSFFFRFGPGAVLLLGDSLNKDWFENRSKDGHIASAIEYVQNDLQDWISQCQAINFEVAISVLKGLLISGWDGKSDYQTTFMNHLGKFIDLKAFREHGKFLPVSLEESSSTSRSRSSSSETPAEIRADYIPGDRSNSARKRRRTEYEADSSLSASDMPVIGTQDNSSCCHLDTWSPSCTDATSINFQQHRPSNDLCAVTHNSPVDGAGRYKGRHRLESPDTDRNASIGLEDVPASTGVSAGPGSVQQTSTSSDDSMNTSFDVDLSLDDVLASADPWLYPSAGPGSVQQTSTSSDDSMNTSFDFDLSLDDVLASADHWLFLHGADRNATSRIPASASGGFQNIGSTHIIAQIGYPSAVSGLSTSNNLTYTTHMQSAAVPKV